MMRAKGGAGLGLLKVGDIGERLGSDKGLKIDKISVDMACQLRSK